MDHRVPIIILSLLLSAFFSGIELAYLGANKILIALNNRSGQKSARILSFFIHKPSHFLTAALVGNSIAVVIYGISVSAWVRDKLLNNAIVSVEQSAIIFVIQAFVGAAVLIIVTEVLAKAVFRNYPDWALAIFSAPFRLFYYLFYPAVIAIVWLSNFLAKNVLGLKTEERLPEFTREELYNYVKESHTVEEDEEVEVDTEIFRNAIEFHSLKVRECMVPRMEIVGIDVNDSIENLKQKLIDSGHSKLIVYNGDIDRIIGYVHLVDLYHDVKNIRGIMMPVIYTTEATPASELLKILIDKHKSLAVVLDDKVDTAGIITIEDIIEEIIGDIEDESDVADNVEHQISENEYVFSGMLEIEYLNNKYNFELPEGDYDTLGGLLLHVHHTIPQPDEVIKIPNYKFTILSVNKARIGEVKMSKVKAPEINEGK